MGHRRDECRVSENRIFCKNCNSRRHNTHPGCKGQIENKNNKNEKKGKENKDVDKKKQKWRNGRKLKSPPPDRANKAESGDADLESDESDDGGSDEGLYSGSASRMQLIVGSIART